MVATQEREAHVRITHELRDQAKASAASQGRKLTWWMNEAVREKLEREKLEDEERAAQA